MSYSVRNISISLRLESDVSIDVQNTSDETHDQKSNTLCHVF